MPEKTPFVHTFTFNCSLIVVFFQMLVGAATIGAAAGIHAIGAAAGEELSRYETPARPALEAPRPEPARRPTVGIPVAFRSSRIGP